MYKALIRRRAGLRIETKYHAFLVVKKSLLVAYYSDNELEKAQRSTSPLNMETLNIMFLSCEEEYVSWHITQTMSLKKHKV